VQPGNNNEIITAEIIEELNSQSSAMVDYYISDLLNMRQTKIMSYCKNLEIIDADYLTSIELDFYNKVMAAFKGYGKMRNIYNVAADTCASESTVDDNIPFCQSDEFQADSNDIEYVLVRILDEIDPLVGFDYNTYGPFKKEDVAKIPKINAIILEKENLAEIIG
jgi:DNA replication initiation complex subunit (GINS family)